MKSAVLIFFSFFCLVGVSQTQYSDYLASQRIFNEDFSKNTNGWVTGLSNDSCYFSKIENGMFEINATCKGIYPIYWITRSIDFTRDFEIEAEICFVKGETDNALSLIWGKDDNFHRFQFGISGNGQFKIFQYNGTWSVFKDWTNSEQILKTNFNKLTVRKIGLKYYYFLNEFLVYTSDFYPFYGNQIGFQDNQKTTMDIKSLKINYLTVNPSYAKGMVTTDINSTKEKKGSNFFIGITGDYILFKGSFDGRSFFKPDNDETILVPKLEPSFGFGIQFGFKWKIAAVDWSYHITRMKYSSLLHDFSGESTTHLIRLLGCKAYLGEKREKSENRILKPYIDFDWSLSFSHFEKMSYFSNDTTNFKSANYSGMIVGLGVGVQVNISKRLTIDMRVLPEYYFGTDVKSKGGQDYPIQKFPNFLLINSIGLNYNF